MKPDFQAMSIKELKTYLLEHRNDVEAIGAIVEKINTSPTTQWYGAEDAERFPEIYKAHQNCDREQTN
jgi:hypothetical protein